MKLAFCVGALVATVLFTSTNALVWEWSGEGARYRAAQHAPAPTGEVRHARSVAEIPHLVEGRIDIRDLPAAMPTTTGRPQARQPVAHRPAAPTRPREITLANLIERDRAEQRRVQATASRQVALK